VQAESTSTSPGRVSTARGRCVRGIRPMARIVTQRPGARAPGPALYRGVMTWETGCPPIVPSVPYPASEVPVMQVDPIIPPGVQSA
jgi:hypothetical protein